MSPLIQKISIPGLNLNARVWGKESGIPVLGMHGWLDNAATFDLIAPLVPELKIVSVDFPGHGFSDFLPPSASYNSIDRAIQMFRVVDALGWQEFSIIGHSLGGIVGEIMAAIAPQRIKKIALIDIFGGLSQPANTIVSQLQRYLQSSEKTLPHTIYSSLDEAAGVRAKLNLTRQLSFMGARILAEGGMQKVPGGYSWTFDLRLHLPTPVLMTDEQLDTILKNFKSDCALILATEGIMHQYRGHTRIPTSPNIKVFELPGGHHLHLDTPKPVAEILAKFFGIA